MPTADHTLKLGGDEGITGKDWTALALGGASFLPMLFGGGQDDAKVKSAVGDLEKSTKRLTAEGQSLSGQGADVLGPALKYLKDVSGGDRQAVLAATMPERRRVMDQYDAAKKSISEFSPRGGGQASAYATLNASQASDLAEVGATARREGIDRAAGIGLNLKGLGLNAEQGAAANLNAIIQTYLTQAQQKGASAASLGEGLASLIATVLL